MIKKNKFGTYTATCSKCGTQEITTAKTFRDILYYLKKKGWHNFQIANHWENKCPTCFHQSTSNTDQQPYWEKD